MEGPLENSICWRATLLKMRMKMNEFFVDQFNMLISLGQRHVQM